ENLLFKADENNQKIVYTKNEYPLTKSGFIPIELNDKKLPNPDSKLIFPGEGGKIYSEIYM
ncbi:MAG: hypothetical protein HQ541_18155, partial [Mariniphaga sp.]|nr:hypothetical protein [Mariniphaga sp.]